MIAIEKPGPRGEGLNGAFYAYCAGDELRFQKCSHCGSWRHMPRYTCAECQSRDWSWEASSGRGTLYSWTTCHRSFHPAFNESLPYAVCVIEMEEGPRLLSQIVDLDPSRFRLGMKVEVTFLPRGDTKIPVFRAVE
jgi:uncharacterized OB-fold protein